MFNDSVSFNGGTRVEVIAVLANCGRDTDKARRALVTWIRHKQDKNRSTEHILVKLRDIESKFIKDTSLHSAFRDARAETFLPRAPDLPLPSPTKRRSQGRTPEATGSPNNTRPSWLSSPSAEAPVDWTRQTSPAVSSSWISSHVLEISPGNSTTNRRVSFSRGAPHIPPSGPPRIEIPRHRSLRLGPSSPTTSSPEDSGIPVRHQHMSHPVGSSSGFTSQMSPPSANSQTSSWPTSSRNRDSVRGLSHARVPPAPLPPIEIPRPSRSQRSFPNSPRTPSSEETDSHSRYHRVSRSRRSMSPGHSRVTPPRAGPPDVPLPPIPSDEQDSDSYGSLPRQNLPGRPPTPVRCITLHPSTPARPLPIQPVPSPVPGSDESLNTDTIGGDSLREHWRNSSGELPLDDVVRQDSPVYMLRDDHASETGIGAPPPYVDQFDTYSNTGTPMIGEALDRAVSVCGGSSEVRLEVSKCIGFRRGYEPPYWHSRLQASGLNAEAARYLVDEMSKHVDWAASFSQGRAS